MFSTAEKCMKKLVYKKGDFSIVRNYIRPSNNSRHLIFNINEVVLIVIICYEGCSNMNASSFITFLTYMLHQNVIPFWIEIFVAFKMAPNIKKHSLYFSSYRRLYKGRSCILKFF